ncbi:hypothetical protein PDK22_27180 [Bacillus cereus group sp. BY122LC]|uniref:hypothetical protein n=1 Tax=Bacillus cereus group TaxID=86661 RepID=UPI0022E38842|nr:hypothetical protein [Bacillus cereus group sp. BY122LC]MDA1861363.1 hypothetical protein [Bacillus cereus group sp. BY122LC]
MFKKIAIICCSLLVMLVSFNPSIYADSPSYQVVGSKGVSIENKGLVGGYYSLKLKVTDAENVVTFQLSELMLVNDCSFNFGLMKWTRPSQKENEFDINIKENGTYAFYVFVNGKVKGYVRFKIKGFPKNAEGTGVTQYWGEGAKYYELPEEAVNPDDFRDQDGANNGICVNEKIPDDKPSGSGDIEEPKEENNNGGNGNTGNNGSNEKLEKALEDINNALKNIETSSKDTANNTKDIADSNKQIKDAVNTIKDTVGEILKEMKPTTDVVIDELKKPDLIRPKDENEKFEDKNEYFKEGKEEKVPTDALPDAPDPKPWKDEDGKEMKKEDKSEKDKPTEKDKPSEKDKPTEKDKPSEKDKTPEKDKPTEKDKPSDKDKTPDRDKPSERDKPSSKDKTPDKDGTPSKDKTPDRDGTPSKDKTPDRDGTPSRDKTPDRDGPSSRDRTPDRDRPSGKDSVPEREAPVGRDPVMSRDPFLTRDPVLR